MKRLASTVAVALAGTRPPCFIRRVGRFDRESRLPHGVGGSYGFARFLERYEAANTAFVNGDPAPWLAITAERTRRRSSAASAASARRVSRPSWSATGSPRPRSAQRRRGRVRVPGQGRARAPRLHRRRRARRRPVHGPDRADTSRCCGPRWCSASSGRLEDRPPARGHDGGPGAAGVEKGVRSCIPAFRRSAPRVRECEKPLTP